MGSQFPTRRGRNPIALIVEDDPDLRVLAAALLEESELQVVECDSAEEAMSALVRDGDDIALVDPDGGGVLATMTVAERYAIDKAHECATVFRTNDHAHPGVRLVIEQGDVNLAGPVRVVATGGFRERFGDLFMYRVLSASTPSLQKRSKQ